MRVILFTMLVLNATIAWPQAPVTRTLTGPRVEFEPQFSDVRSIRELSDGRVIVVDYRELTVKIIDPRSGAAVSIGRTGDGPGEYRRPSRLYPLRGDSTLLQDIAGGRLMIIAPDGKPGAFFDPNRPAGDSAVARARRFFIRFGDGRGHLFGEAQPIRVGAGGVLQLTDHAAVERLTIASGKRDTIALWPLRKDANPRLIEGSVLTQPRMQAFAAWEHWTVSPEGRVAFVFFDPYRVDFVDANGRVIQNAPIPYDRVRVDDALKQQFKEERERVSPGGAAAQVMAQLSREPTEWPEFLPPYLGNSQFDPAGLLWIPRAVAAGKPALYDIIDRKGKLVERVQLPPRTKLVGFGTKSAYLVRLDEVGLQYLQRYVLPTTARP